jgi:hypothetical protein
VAGNVDGTYVAMAQDMLVLKRRAGGGVSEYAVVDLSGRTLEVFDRDEANWATGDIAFDGRRIAWVSHLGGLQTTVFGDAAVLSDVAIRPRRFAAASASAVFRFRLARRSNVDILIDRSRRGRHRRIGVVHLGHRSGRVRWRFRGIVERRVLRPGRYRATVRAVALRGRRTTVKRARFIVTP